MLTFEDKVISIRRVSRKYVLKLKPLVSLNFLNCFNLLKTLEKPNKQTNKKQNSCNQEVDTFSKNQIINTIELEVTKESVGCTKVIFST